MEKLIEMLHEMHAEAGALAWLALGFLLPVLIIACLIALRWIRNGGLARSSQEFFVQQREIATRLKDPYP